MGRAPGFQGQPNLSRVRSHTEDGHEEAFHRRADYWLPEAGGRWHPDQGAVPLRRAKAQLQNAGSISVLSRTAAHKVNY